jgi:hypothetical protein
MTEERSIRQKAHRSNISRYRWLLGTSLTELERRFIEKRLGEEQSALEKLVVSAAPIARTTSGRRLPLAAINSADAPGSGW